MIPLATDDEFGLLYAEPVYLQAEGIDFPELKQVILATGDRVVMEGSVMEAVASLTGFTSPVVTAGEPQRPQAPAATVPGNELQREMETLSDAIDAIKRELSNLEKALKRLGDLTGGE